MIQYSPPQLLLRFTPLQVETVTLEQVLPPDLSFVYLAKVDTEGAELSVLHAMMPFISKRKVS